MSHLGNTKFRIGNITASTGKSKSHPDSHFVLKKVPLTDSTVPGGCTVKRA